MRQKVEGLTMERKTRRNGNEVELVGDYDSPMDAMVDMLFKMCDYEDEAEKREQGCTRCKPSCSNCRSFSMACWPEQIRPFVCKDYYPNSNYCYNCGRKLSKED